MAKITVATFQKTVLLPSFVNRPIPGQISHQWLIGEVTGTELRRGFSVPRADLRTFQQRGTEQALVSDPPESLFSPLLTPQCNILEQLISFLWVSVFSSAKLN